MDLEGHRIRRGILHPRLVQCKGVEGQSKVNFEPLLLEYKQVLKELSEAWSPFFENCMHAFLQAQERWLRINSAEVELSNLSD